MSYLGVTKKFKGVADVWARDPELYLPLAEFVSAVMTRESDLSVAQREMIAGYVSSLNQCDFCVGVHKQTLISLNVDSDIIDCVFSDKEDFSSLGEFSEILKFSRILNLTHLKVEQEHIDALVQSGWSEQTIEDAINVVALFNYVNRLVDGLGIKSTEDYYKMVGGMLASQGYQPIIGMLEK